MAAVVIAVFVVFIVAAVAQPASTGFFCNPTYYSSRDGPCTGAWAGFAYAIGVCESLGGNIALANATTLTNWRCGGNCEACRSNTSRCPSLCAKSLSGSGDYGFDSRVGPVVQNRQCYPAGLTGTLYQNWYWPTAVRSSPGTGLYACVTNGSASPAAMMSLLVTVMTLCICL